MDVKIKAKHIPHINLISLAKAVLRKIVGLLFILISLRFIQLGFSGDELGFCALILLPFGLFILLHKENIYE